MTDIPPSTVTRKSLGSELVLALLLVLAGCGGTHTCPACLMPAESTDSVEITDISTLSLRLQRSFADKAGPNTMLMLSGGGGSGAWGAGLLNGWTKQGSRPVFDVVTGVSTGAMLGVFAFLGEPPDDALLAKQYTSMGPGDIYRPHPLLWALLFSSALNSTEPLRELLPVTSPTT